MHSELDLSNERHGRAKEVLRKWMRKNGFHGQIRQAESFGPSRNILRGKYIEFFLFKPRGVYRVYYESGRVVDKSSAYLKAKALRER